MPTNHSKVREEAIFKYKTTLCVIDQKLRELIFACVIYQRFNSLDTYLI
jgi:hypothetical protein